MVGYNLAVLPSTAEQDMVLERVTRAVEVSVPLRVKLDTLRQVASGDRTQLDEEAPKTLEMAPGFAGATAFAPWTSLRYQSQVEAAARNRILEQVMILGAQTQNRAPSIEWEGIDPIEAQVNALYIKSLMMDGPVNYWVEEMSLALADLLVTGMSCVLVGGRDGKPVIKRLDPVTQVVFDPDAEVVSRARYAAVCLRAPLFEWVEIYGEEAFKDLLTASERQDQPVELVMYWDRDGEKGRHCVYRTDVGGVDGIVVFEENPFYAESNRAEEPFIPIAATSIWQMPGIIQPVSLVENMTPHQMTTARIDAAINDQAELSRGLWMIEKGGLTPEGLEAFKSGDPNRIVEMMKGGVPPTFVAGGDISETLLVLDQRSEQALVASGGGNPYAGGGRLPGVKFASEVQAVAQNSGLMSTLVAQVHASTWAKVTWMALAYGIVYDQGALRLFMDDIELVFGGDRPVGDYLNLGGDIVVSEDTMAFVPKSVRVQEALAGLNTALSVAAMFPGAAKQAYQEFLTASGVRNVTPYLEQPAPMMSEAAELAGDTNQ